jgi:hypothetical protein
LYYIGFLIAPSILYIAHWLASLVRDYFRRSLKIGYYKTYTNISDNNEHENIVQAAGDYVFV